MTFPARKRGSEFMKIKCLMPDVQFEMPAKGRLGEGGVTGYLAGLGVDGPKRATPSATCMPQWAHPKRACRRPSRRHAGSLRGTASAPPPSPMSSLPRLDPHLPCHFTSCLRWVPLPRPFSSPHQKAFQTAADVRPCAPTPSTTGLLRPAHGPASGPRLHARRPARRVRWPSLS